jgi:hypothetical protein
VECLSLATSVCPLLGLFRIASLLRRSYQVSVFNLFLLVRLLFDFLLSLRLLGLKRQPRRRLAHVELTSDHVGDQAGTVFAEQVDFTPGLMYGRIGRRRVGDGPSHDIRLF